MPELSQRNSLAVGYSRQSGQQIHSLQSCTPTEQMLYLRLGEPEMRLTKERIFRAGVVQGLLMREEQNWYQMLNTWPETKRVIEKSVWKKFAKKNPEAASEYRETVGLLFDRKRV